MNEDKYLDELFSSAKKQDNLLDDNEIQSLLEASNKTISKTNFGVNKMKMYFYAFTAVAIISYFGYNIFENNEVEPVNYEIKPKVQNEIANNSEPIIEPIIKDDSKDIKDNAKIKENSNEIDDSANKDDKKIKKEISWNEDNSQKPQNMILRKIGKIETVKPSRLIKLNEEELKNLGIIRDGNSLKFSFDEKDDKASVVKLSQYTSFKIDAGKPLNSITPKFVSGKNGLKIMSFFDDKNTVAYRTNKVNSNGKKQVTTILKRNYNEDDVEFDIKIDKSNIIKNFNDSILKNHPEIIDKMIKNKKESENDEEIILNNNNIDKNQISKILSQNENSHSFNLGNGIVFIKDSKNDIANFNSIDDTSKLINIEFEEDFDIVSDKDILIEKSEFNNSNINSQSSLKSPKSNFVVIKKYGKDGKSTETRIENKNEENEMKINDGDINLDSILLSLNINLEEIDGNTYNNMVSLVSKFGYEKSKFNEKNSDLLISYLKSMAMQESIESYFTYDINKLIPVEIKFDGENLDYVLWFKPSKELFERLPQYLQNKLGNEFEILQNSESAYCGEAPVEEPVSDMWNGCNGAIRNLKLYPIPAGDEINFDFELTSDRALNIAITDINGKEIISISKGESYNAGVFKEAEGVANIPPGIYYLTISSDNGEIVNQRFIKE